MPKETIEEFLARGGKVTKSEDNDLTLKELLEKEGVLTEEGAKRIADIISHSITSEIDSKLPKK